MPSSSLGFYFYFACTNFMEGSFLKSSKYWSFNDLNSLLAYFFISASMKANLAYLSNSSAGSFGFSVIINIILNEYNCLEHS